MYLKQISLQNFRSYSKSSFDFDKGTTLIIGPNTSGKTNLIEAIFLLATGKSFRAEKDLEMIALGKEFAHVAGDVISSSGQVKLKFTLTLEGQKKYMVNGVAKRRADFAGNLVVVLFSPLDLDIIVASPGLRRRFLDEVLEQVDREYRYAKIAYDKALRQRNALLDRAREEGRRDEKHFAYWDDLLITNGQIITKKREELIAFFNSEEKETCAFEAFYDKSVISKERLLQYREAEVGAGATLVGPHRDDLSIHMPAPYQKGAGFHDKTNATRDVKLFGSRGQQRLAILQLKLLTLSFVEKAIGERPMLLLDDIFSELDNEHIHHVLQLIGKQQTILTTTHREFVPKKMLKKVATIELSEGK